jgi:integrase
MTEWIQLETLALSPGFLGQNFKHSHVVLALNFLEKLLCVLFQTPCITKLCNAKICMEFLCDVASAVQKVASQLTWQRKTLHNTMRVVRAIVSKTTAHPSLLRMLRTPRMLSDANPVLGPIGRLAKTHPKRITLESWQAILSKRTEIRSEQTQKNMLSFLVRDVLGPQLDVTDPDLKTKVVAKLQDVEVVKHLVLRRPRPMQYLNYLQIFVTKILGSDHDLPVHAVKKCVDPRPQKITDGSDEHRISKEHLELLYDVAKQDYFDELFFLVLITTGMRVGGFVKMKVAEVAILQDGKYVCKQEGKTQEKSSKIFTFWLHPRVQALLEIHLNKKRKFVLEEYVFPGRSRPHVHKVVVTKRFATMCQKAKLQGKEFHVHALRHSYAHILFECGNSADVISKLLNHSDVQTTKKYYLCESAAQVAKRAVIPWMENCDIQNDAVPNFLRNSTATRMEATRLKLLSFAQEP